MQTLNRLVRGTECFRDAEASERMIRLPTGDGMVLMFFRSPKHRRVALVARLHLRAVERFARQDCLTQHDQERACLCSEATKRRKEVNGFFQELKRRKV